KRIWQPRRWRSAWAPRKLPCAATSPRSCTKSAPAIDAAPCSHSSKNERRRREPMILAVAVVFLNEEDLLPILLDSIARQTRHPDRFLLVDDGSSDASPEIARRFASEHGFAKLVRRPQRAREADRLAAAAELQAFQWAVAQLDEAYDVIAKLDADL